MSKWAIPPKAKVYEALSALADGRVALEAEGKASVKSSDGKKAYTVVWTTDGLTFSSNDNASYWQGYIGYPVIAVLLALGRLKYSSEIAEHLKGIPWKKLNTKFKRDYDKAIDHVLIDLQTRGVSREDIEQEVERIFVELAEVELERGKGAGFPPS